jgi:hypothetical protein
MPELPDPTERGTMSTATTTRYCEAVVIRETRQDPAEYCENEALEDSDYCEALGATLYGMYALYRWARNAPPTEHKPHGYYYGEK